MSSGVQILLVEDNPSHVALAVHAFEMHNLAKGVQVVRDGREAIDYVFRTGPHTDRTCDSDPQVILLDLKLPKGDGHSVLRRIKADEATRDIPVVVLTSSQAESDLAEAYTLGVNSHIVEPVDLDQFGEEVRLIGFYWLLLNRRPERRRAVLA